MHQFMTRSGGSCLELSRNDSSRMSACKKTYQNPVQHSDSCNTATLLEGSLRGAPGSADHAEGRPAEDTVTPCAAAISQRRSEPVSRRVVHLSPARVCNLSSPACSLPTPQRMIYTVAVLFTQHISLDTAVKSPMSIVGARRSST